jgi:hypothetical protein
MALVKPSKSKFSNASAKAFGLDKLALRGEVWVAYCEERAFTGTTERVVHLLIPFQCTFCDYRVLDDPR